MSDQKHSEFSQNGLASGRFTLELVAMVAVIAISSWHVGNYMATFDGWVMATIMGATLGFCNFLMAHNIFKPRSTSRFASFCGLIFFAVTSTYMQYTYFDANPDIGKTMIWHVNWDAFALGIWAPAAEILLGWIYAAGLRGSVQHRSNRPTASRFERIGEALTSRVERKLYDVEPADQRSTQAVKYERGPHLNGTHGSTSDSTGGRGGNERAHATQAEQSVDVQGVQTERPALSKEAALERMAQIYRVNPAASYAEIAAAIGRSKATVANYVRELRAG